MKKKRILAFLLTMALAVSQLAGTHGLTVQAGLGVEDEGNGTDITFEACTHDKQEKKAVTPTCTTPGNIHYYYCETCNAYWDAEENITSQADTILAATGHEMGSLIEQAPTCTEPGVKAHYHCEKCQKDFEDNAKDTTKEITDTVVPATGHKYNNAEWVSGITHHWYKMVCECSKKTTEEQEEIAKEEAEKSGYAEHTDKNTDNKCDVCGAAMHKHEMEQIPAKDSSCIEKGNNKYYYCSGCKKYYKDEAGKTETTPKKEERELGEHEFTEKEVTKEHIWKDATCTEAAVYYVSCKTCKKNGAATFTAGTAKGHTYQNKVEAKYLKAPATCTSPAVYYTSCKECGAKGTTTFTAGTAKGHTYQNKVEAKYLKAPATCTSPAEYYTSCKECGEKGTTTFISGTEKGHTYKTVVKEATTKKDGQTVEKCSSCGAEKNKKTIYKASKVSLKTTALSYTGKAQKPTLIVKDSKGSTINKKYYTVTWTKGCKTVGTYKATVTFKGNYSGSKTLSFKINPKKISIKKPAAAKKAFTVKWSKQKKSLVDGYQVWYSTDKKFKKAVSKKTVKNNGKVASYKASKLKGNKTYYVKVRSYKKVGKTTYYSDWSSVQKVKAKK